VDHVVLGDLAQDRAGQYSAAGIIHPPVEEVYPDAVNCRESL
jgi:hypothetical protein